MHDFSVFRTVHGPYDVPLDDPKPRFGQQRRKNRPRPCCHAPFLYGSTLDLRGISSRSSKRDDGRGVDAAAAGAATPHALVVRAPERDHVHRRGVLYILLSVRPPIPRRHMPPRLGKQLGRTHRRSRTLVPKKRRAASLVGQDTGPRQVWSHREASLPPIFELYALVHAPRPPCHLTSPSSARAQVCCSGPVWAR